jgi:hypothetical protein
MAPIYTCPNYMILPTNGNGITITITITIAIAISASVTPAHDLTYEAVAVITIRGPLQRPLRELRLHNRATNSQCSFINRHSGCRHCVEIFIGDGIVYYTIIRIVVSTGGCF